MTPGIGSGTGAAVIRSSLLTMLAIAALGITRLVHISLVGRSVPEGDPTLALVGVLIGVTLTAGLFLPGGLSSASSKFISYHLGRGDPATAQAVYRLLSWIGYASSAALGAVVGIGALLFGVPGPDAFSVGLLTFVFSVYSIEKAALYGFGRVASYVRLELIGSSLAIAATVVVVASGWRAYLLPLTLGYAVLIFGAWLALRRSSTTVSPRAVLGSVPAGDRREIAGYVALASLGGLAAAGFLQSLPLIASVYTTHVEVEHFVTTVSLVAPLFFLPRALGMALFPAMAHAHGAGDLASVRKQADLSTRGLFAFLAPLFVLAIILSRQILILVFGPRFADGALVLQVILVATFLMVTQVGAVNALSSGSPRLVRIPVSSAVAGCLSAIVATIPLGLMLGELGIALAYLIAAAISASGPLTMAARRHDLSWRGPILRAIAVVVAALAVTRVLAVLTAGTGNRWFIDATLAVVAGLLAAAILWRDIRYVLGGREGNLPEILRRRRGADRQS